MYLKGQDTYGVILYNLKELNKKRYSILFVPDIRRTDLIDGIIRMVVEDQWKITF